MQDWRDAMSKEEYFCLSFQEKCHFVRIMRENLYAANTMQEATRAIPHWLVDMLNSFEVRYKYRNFTSLLLQSLLVTTCLTQDEEIVCVLDEIELEVLNFTIQHLEETVGLSWTNFLEDNNRL